MLSIDINNEKKIPLSLLNQITNILHKTTDNFNGTDLENSIIEKSLTKFMFCSQEESFNEDNIFFEKEHKLNTFLEKIKTVEDLKDLSIPYIEKELIIESIIETTNNFEKPFVFDTFLNEFRWATENEGTSILNKISAEMYKPLHKKLIHLKFNKEEANFDYFYYVDKDDYNHIKSILSKENKISFTEEYFYKEKKQTSKFQQRTLF